MKILITGSNGFLAGNLARFFLSRGHALFGIDLQKENRVAGLEYHACDLLDRETTERVFCRVKPDAVINTIAVTSLDLCETDPPFAERINALTARNAAAAAHAVQARLIHISTDHLFQGERPFYREDDKTHPVNEYGRTKLLAEQYACREHSRAVIVRTNFYGWSDPAHPPTFAEWLFQSLRDGVPITLYTDYWYTPIEAVYLAEALAVVIDSDFSGIINIVGRERCSKFEFGMKMAEIFQFSTAAVKAAPIDPDSFTVQRQSDLSLSIEKFETLFSFHLPDVGEGLRRFKESIPPQ